ncbi:MAG: hypothetical protein IJS31_02980 [Oscillospiraceae bacterium]|nr:hypothetical protein [Oscillospiraceae bacterium]
MKKFLTVFFVMMLAMLLCACDERASNDETNSSEPVLTVASVSEDSPQFDSTLFEKTSLEYDNDLALVCADLCDKAEWDPPAGGKPEQPLQNAYDSYGIQDFEQHLFDSGTFGGGAFVIGHKQINDATILVITLRGTKTFAENIGDFFKGEPVDFYGNLIHHNVYDFYDDIPPAIEQYIKTKNIDTEGCVKYLISGHSLGGATAGVFAAMLNKDIENGVTKWGASLKKEDVYCYTFGAIKVLLFEKNIEDGYENIHNIFNYYDSFAENGISFYRSNEASSYYYKFGHTEIYQNELLHEEENENEFMPSKNHQMQNYLNALYAEAEERDFGNPEAIIQLACRKTEEAVQSEDAGSAPAETTASAPPDDFTIQGFWESVGSYGFGQAQPGATVAFDGTNCNFYSPFDTYQFYQEDGKWRLACKNVLWQDIQYFTVTVLDINHIEIVHDGSDQKTVLQRVSG